MEGLSLHTPVRLDALLNQVNSALVSQAQGDICHKLHTSRGFAGISTGV